MSNLFWEIKIFPVTALHMECIIIVTRQIWLKGLIAKILGKVGKEGKTQKF